MFQRPQFTFSELDFQLDIGSCRSRLGSESEEYFSDDSPGCWSNSLEEFKFNGRDVSSLLLNLTNVIVSFI